MKTCWIYENGFTDYPIPRKGWWQKFTAMEVVMFRLKTKHPLTLFLPIDGEVMLVQPDRKFDSDMASVPILVRGLPGYSKSAYKRSSYIHDSGCRSAKRHDGVYGLWTCHLEAQYVEDVQNSFPATWKHVLLDLNHLAFEPMDSPRVHEILRLCLPADDCPAYRANIYWSMVRVFGPRFKNDPSVYSEGV